MAIPESMVLHGGRANMFVVFKLVSKSDNGVMFFAPPSFRCGQYDIKCVGDLKMWDVQVVWTVTIKGEALTASLGARVVQGTSIGRLSVALTGTVTTTIVITSSRQVPIGELQPFLRLLCHFNMSADVVIESVKESQPILRIHKSKIVSVTVATQKKLVTKSRLAKLEVRSLTIVDAKPSLLAAAATLTSYLIQRVEKSTVYCDKCKKTFRMNVDTTTESAKANGIITWSAQERQQYIATQKEMGIKTFSEWEIDNYVNKCRSWFANYVAWGKLCPGCTTFTVHHKCMNCHCKMSECLASPCEWQRTKNTFWSKK